jgi:hypothetical protein
MLPQNAPHVPDSAYQPSSWLLDGAAAQGFVVPTLLNCQP